MNYSIENVRSIGKGAVIAGIGALLTYAIQHLGEVDMGKYGPLVGATLAIPANVVRKYTEPTPAPTPPTNTPSPGEADLAP